MRIIAGSRKGHRIEAPAGLATRPTSDRAREAVFNLVQSWVDGAIVLDLFAGSGALGLEALSRGAKRAVFVDESRAACRAIERNLDKLRLTGADVRCEPVERFLATDRGRYDLVFVDPPYDEVDALVPKLARYLPALLADDALVVLESSARDPEPDLPLAPRTRRRYGAARISLYEA